jgi:hypothetical protein
MASLAPALALLATLQRHGSMLSGFRGSVMMI